MSFMLLGQEPVDGNGVSAFTSTFGVLVPTRSSPRPAPSSNAIECNRMTVGSRLILRQRNGDAMAWWRRKPGGNGAQGEQSNRPPSETTAPPVWREATANPFGVRVLDSTPTTRGLTVFSGDRACAERAISWAASTGSELDGTDLDEVSPIGCELRYPVASVFPDGLLFVPSGMEDKWVLAHRGRNLMAARSWTGIVDAVADSRQEDDVLVVGQLRVRPGSALRSFGDVVPVFDWLIRSHALGQALPLPVGDDALAQLERSPLDAFTAFGQRAFCAARTGTPWPPPPHPLWSDGAVLLAVCKASVERVRLLHRSGEPIDAPTTFGGNTPLTAAVIRGDVAMVRALLELGANPRARSSRGKFPRHRRGGPEAGRPTAPRRTCVASGETEPRLRALRPALASSHVARCVPPVFGRAPRRG